MPVLVALFRPTPAFAAGVIYHTSYLITSSNVILKVLTDEPNAQCSSVTGDPTPEIVRKSAET
jgi:hypothetical protein